MTAELQSIRERFDAIIPGPWRWFGNTASDRIYLGTVNRGRLIILSPDTRTEEYVYDQAACEGYTMAEAGEHIEEWCGAHPDLDDIEVDLEDFERWGPNYSSSHFGESRPDTRELRVLDWVDEVWAALEDHYKGREWDCICPHIERWLSGTIDPAEGHQTFGYGIWDNEVNSDHPTHGRLIRGVQVHADLRFPEPPNPGWAPEAVERRQRHGGIMQSYRRLARYEVLGRKLADYFSDYRTRAEYEAEETKPVAEALYREDFIGLANPEATFIEHAPEDVGFLLNRVETLERELAELRERHSKAVQGTWGHPDQQEKL